MSRTLVVGIRVTGWPKLGVVVSLKLPDGGPNVRDVVAGAYRAGVMDTAASDQLADQLADRRHER